MDLQIEYLLLLQHFREATHGIFDSFFMTMTWFGELFIPVSFLSVIYWAVNKRAGTFLLFSFALTLYINVFLKMTTCINRPWLIDERVCPLAKALPTSGGYGYSFPSGHTAGATSVWGGVAFWWWKNRYVRYFALTLVFLVALSRNYVGLHTPQDVIVSMIIGVGILFTSDWVLKWIDKKKNRDLLIITVIALFSGLLYIYLCIKCNLQMRHFNNLTDLVNPIEMKHGVYGKLGFMIGIFTGWILEKRFVKFEISGSWKSKILTAIFGLVLFFFSLFIMDKVFAYFLPKHITSFVCAIWASIYISLIYPIIIKKFFSGS